MKNRISYW